MVGLAPVERQIGELLAQAEIDADRREAGLPVKQSTMHLVFAGAPGTGKTTVAREIGQMYYHMGLVSKDPSTDEGWVEASRASLVRPYQGQTADAVRVLFEGDGKTKAGHAGGVIFIDEAYDLYHGEQDAYGREAVTELLRQAENHREDTVVILAGYGKEMDDLFKSNPGLNRRFPTTLNFPEMDLDDRYKVMQKFFSDAKYVAGKGKAAQEVRHALMDALQYTGAGNAGDVRNLFEKIETAQRVRLMGKGKPRSARDLSTITVDDVRAGTQSFISTARVENPIKGALIPTSRKKPAARTRLKAVS
jgi:SpoVK/Ycf46/Vps4 family AAA+-type ATPase